MSSYYDVLPLLQICDGMSSDKEIVGEVGEYIYILTGWLLIIEFCLSCPVLSSLVVVATLPWQMNKINRSQFREEAFS